MKIAHCMQAMIWGPGGVRSYVRRISAAQREAGHEIYYVVAGGLMPEPFDPEGIEILQVQDAADLSRQIAHYHLDVVHAHSILFHNTHPGSVTLRTLHGHQPYCPSGTRYLRREDTPCGRSYSLTGCLWGHVVDRCGSARPANIVRNFRATHDEMRTLAGTPVVTVSHFLHREMLRAGYREDLVTVLHLPTPIIEVYEPPPRLSPPRFLFLGRITPQKGVEWLLRAVQEAPGVHLDIAGDGYLGPEMRLLAERLRLSDRVTFHGWVDEQTTFRLLAHARALIVPSVWHEPGATVAFEAMAHGRAVVGSRVGGIPELVKSDTTGLIVAPNDIHGLAQAITRLAQDWELARAMGQRGRGEAQRHFSLDRHMRMLYQLYDRYMAYNKQGSGSAVGS